MILLRNMKPLLITLSLCCMSSLSAADRPVVDERL